MPPSPILDLATIDLTRVVADKEAIRACNAQRYEMEQLDAIIYFDPDSRIIVGYKDVRADEFWVRGHIPGRPLLPGVLMIEAAAQLASYYMRSIIGGDRFIGFAGVDEVKFRDVVVPPARLYLLAKGLEKRPRRVVCYVQGFVAERMVFEGKITGMPV